MKGIFRSAEDQRRIKIRRLIAMLLGAGFCASALPALAEKNPLRDVFFGETHIHTSWSFDAFVFGNTLAGPEEAYQYAMGKAIRHPGGYMVQMKRPLDFEAVTDHAEYMGTVPLANDPTSDLSKLPIAEKLKVRSREDIEKIYLFLGESLLKNEPIKDLTSPEVAGAVWKRIVEIADKYNQPGKFTTFAAYEWTSTPDNRNLHRNIIFKDTKKVPTLPFTAIERPTTALSPFNSRCQKPWLTTATGYVSGILVSSPAKKVSSSRARGCSPSLCRPAAASATRSR